VAAGRVPGERCRAVGRAGRGVALVVAAFVFLLLLIVAAVFGALLVALPGTARIVQLRMLGRRLGVGADPKPPPPAAGPEDTAGL
jgi:uncharacterized integral membrane protein